MAKHVKHGTKDDPLARKQIPEEQKNERDTGVDWPTGAPGVDPDEARPNFYEEIGLKNRPAVNEKFLNEPPPATMVDKDDASKHQAEGPGGKGGLGGGGGA